MAEIRIMKERSFDAIDFDIAALRHSSICGLIGLRAKPAPSPLLPSVREGRQNL